MAQQGLAALLGELYSGVEYLEALRSPLNKDLPRGKGRPVLLLPGLWGGDRSLSLLRRDLNRLGHDARTWGLGLNNRCGEATVVSAAEKVRAVVAQRDQPIALIGHSRGGIIAREVARRLPTMVDMVITLGTPIRTTTIERANPMVQAMIAVSRTIFARRPGCFSERCDCAYVRNLGSPLPADVVVCSLWSQNDGVVDHEDCIVGDEPGIEVRASHLGMLASREVLAAIAQLLSNRARDPLTCL